ncbi:hypothetical protein QBC34DRAFT_402696 [Podospora aff. communis PSN243]|uniref:Uncharacterized protein n=1 Tax=Podospora aff. communis PSN243 TaxID=3040156 RepID=A0AAV9GSJ4_9PEZI|nr:hypothetical protein QBC34DRAFT_402696 [Podospora aff. communis PSN243]
MFTNMKPLIFFLATALSFASASSLCLQGCCDQALKLASTEISLSSGTTISLPDAQIPCCECPNINSPNADNTIVHDNTQVPLTAPSDDDPDPLTAKLPPFSILPCPESCPSCAWCEPLNAPHFTRPTYNTIRNLIGCESLPEETPVCPVGKCAKNCLCRETLMKSLSSALGGDFHPDTNPNSDESTDIPEFTTDLPVLPVHNQRLIPKLPPWYGVKPVCTEDCPCCDYCQPIHDWCLGYRAAWFKQPYPAARKAVGCEVLPATTPLCPVGECGEKCVCRESLLKRLDGIFFGEE